VQKQKVLNLRDSIEDPSPVTRANMLLIVDQDDGMLPYKATFGLIVSSKHRIAQRDIDPYLLSLLKVSSITFTVETFLGV